MGGVDRFGNARKFSLSQMRGDGEAKAEEKSAEKTEGKEGAKDGEKKQQNQYAKGLEVGGINNPNAGPEKVHVLETPIAKTHTTFYLGKDKRDIAEPGMEPNTHAFANDNVDIVNADKSHGPWIPNGSQAGWISTQSRTRDMADPGGFEPNVLAFSNPQVDVLNSVDYHHQPNLPNGGKAGWPSLSQRAQNDIAEPGMEPNTHAFSNDNVDVLNAPKNHGAWTPNGS